MLLEAKQAYVNCMDWAKKVHLATFILHGQLISAVVFLFHRHGVGNRDGDKHHKAKGKNGEGFHVDICQSIF